MGSTIKQGPEGTVPEGGAVSSPRKLSEKRDKLVIYLVRRDIVEKEGEGQIRVIGIFLFEG